ncbi:MAG: pilus assembly protein [Acidobacteriia bacterium]|nr:pilus assembly protein [Terriglobia bacterium]
MKILRKSPHHRRGVAIVEFTFALVFLIPLLLGVFVFGFRLVRSLQMQQIVRDLGHMYIRGVNFRNPGPQQNARTLAQSFDLSPGGQSLIVLSQIRILQQSDCDAANPASPGVACTNLNSPVFTEQLMIGNTSLAINGVRARSAFGTPPLKADCTVSSTNQANSQSAAAAFTPVMTLKAGEFAYVAEMITATPALNIPGFSGSPQVYARAIF